MLEPSRHERDGHPSVVIRHFSMPSVADFKAGAGHVFYEIGKTSIATTLRLKLRPIQGDVCAELLSSGECAKLYIRFATNCAVDRIIVRAARRVSAHPGHDPSRKGNQTDFRLTLFRFIGASRPLSSRAGRKRENRKPCCRPDNVWAPARSTFQFSDRDAIPAAHCRLG